MSSFQNPGLTEIILRLTIATLVGCVIGLNRDLRGKPAGLRTHSLVTLGSALLALAILHVSITTGGVPGDALSRVIQGVVTGIGFLGAGVIIRDPAGHVRGLTTAATIWLSASLGIVCGIGYWLPVTVAMVLIFIVLLLGGPMELFVERFFGRTGNDGSPK